ncbi:MAG: hypothetical protein AAFR64_04045 [Pseudomonadota bacterium]
MTHPARFTAIGLALIALSACASTSEGNELDPSAGFGFLFATPATTEYPPYVVCNGDRCGLRDKDGNITQMSKEERNNYRLGIELAEERARDAASGFPPPQIPAPAAPQPGNPVRPN